jgi:hypothetical protein
MEQMVLNTAEFRQLYNCSIYNVTIVPLEQRQNLLLGIIFVLISVIEEVCACWDEVEKLAIFGSITDSVTLY